MNVTPDQKIIVQTVAKAAAKTFLQAAIAILALLLVPHLGTWVTTVQEGGTIDIDIAWWGNVLLAATGGGIAALISAVWNWTRGPSYPPPPVPPAAG